MTKEIKEILNIVLKVQRNIPDMVDALQTAWGETETDLFWHTMGELNTTGHLLRVVIRMLEEIDADTKKASQAIFLDEHNMPLMVVNLLQ